MYFSTLPKPQHFKGNSLQKKIKAAQHLTQVTARTAPTTARTTRYRKTQSSPCWCHQAHFGCIRISTRQTHPVVQLDWSPGLLVNLREERTLAMLTAAFLSCPRTPAPGHSAEWHLTQFCHRGAIPNGAWRAFPLSILHKVYLALAFQKGVYRYTKPHVRYTAIYRSHSSVFFQPFPATMGVFFKKENTPRLCIKSCLLSLGALLTTTGKSNTVRTTSFLFTQHLPESLKF